MDGWIDGLSFSYIKHSKIFIFIFMFQNLLLTSYYLQSKLKKCLKRAFKVSDTRKFPHKKNKQQKKQVILCGNQKIVTDWLTGTQPKDTKMIVMCRQAKKNVQTTQVISVCCLSPLSYETKSEYKKVLTSSKVDCILYNHKNSKHDRECEIVKDLMTKTTLITDMI